MVKVKEAWADMPEKETAVVRRRKKEEKEMNLINNNGEDANDDVTAKRRSFHPQDHLSKVLDASSPGTVGGRIGRRRRRPADFPKVSFAVVPP